MISYKPASVVSQNVWHWAEQSFGFHNAAWGWKIFLCHSNQSRKSQIIDCPVHKGFLWTMHSGLSKVCFQLYGSGCWRSALRCICTSICNFFKNTVQTTTCLVTVRPFISWCAVCLRCGCRSHNFFATPVSTFLVPAWQCLCWRKINLYTLNKKQWWHLHLFCAVNIRWRNVNYSCIFESISLSPEHLIFYILLLWVN